MGSEKTNGATPLQLGAFSRQISNGPAIISEFNPLNEDVRENALDNPQIKKTDQNMAAMQQVLVDNFLKTQTVLNGVKLQGKEMKTMPSSPITAGGI
jgi:hypothetical protein